MIMKPKTITIGLLLLIIAVAASGCTEKPDIQTIESYRCTVDNGTLDLWSNGEYELLPDERFDLSGTHGNYTILDGTLRLKRSFIGDLVKFEIVGRDLIDRDGDRWVLF